MWNMQSGIKRRTFKLGVCPPEGANRIHSNNSENEKERSVVGIAVDPLNVTVVLCTMDGTVNVRSSFHLS
jgi:U3 small nucleolar RNA-associated protein 21